jgi:hypothetical protein
MDPTSLERLHDIVAPPPTPWWPPAPGWLWLLGFAALVALYAATRWFVRWQRNRYRREALAELARLEADASDPSKRANALAGLSVLLKRTALTAYGREAVASLTGQAWFEFLDGTGGTHFADGPGSALESAVYRANADYDGVKTDDLFAEVRRWIRGHGPMPDASAETGDPREVSAASIGKAA